LIQQGMGRGVLGLCPLSIMQSAWETDLFKFATHRTCAIAHSYSKEKRIKAVESDAEFVICNYDGLDIVKDAVVKGGFDLIIIDECHRGGASDESTWRDILKYFSPAVQLGLTATPKRDQNVDTYKYFGDPVYIYSLKEGINDGFLTPFKLRQITTTLDEYVYTPDDKVVEGDVQEGKRYTEAEFNRIIEIKAREEYRVKLFMSEIDQREKTLVFCATQDHALAVRDLINQNKTSTDPNYCHRVTADDGEVGEQHLRDFQDNERNSPVILTTSQKLSTGVDARNVRNIVLLRPVKSMIEFKQIIGRGTRTFDGKDFFTVYDFVKAYEHFNDPEWDGEPLPPNGGTGGGGGGTGGGGEGDDGSTGGGDPKEPTAKVVVKLADGKERKIRYIAATTYMFNGRPITAQEFMEHLFGDLGTLVTDEDDLRAIWSDPERRMSFIQRLTEMGYDNDRLEDMRRLIDAPNSDIFDVLAYIRFTLAPLARAERVAAAKAGGMDGYEAEMREFLSYVLQSYEIQGIRELEPGKLSDFLRIRYGGTNDAKRKLGSVAAIRGAFIDIQRHLFQ